MSTLLVKLCNILLCSIIDTKLNTESEHYCRFRKLFYIFPPLGKSFSIHCCSAAFLSPSFCVYFFLTPPNKQHCIKCKHYAFVLLKQNLSFQVFFFNAKMPAFFLHIEMRSYVRKSALLGRPHEEMLSLVTNYFSLFWFRHICLPLTKYFPPPIFSRCFFFLQTKARITQTQLGRICFHP